MNLKFWKRAVAPSELPEPREPVTVTVQNAHIRIWVRVSDAETLCAKTLRLNPWRNRFGDVETYPATQAVNDFFAGWRARGFAELNGGYVARWEDFICAPAGYIDREVTLP